ncbi:MAG: AmmeMemoRadiSam system protein A [Treponema sp.]|jgi:AmmeMemoRadiSam system protein A/AmmeMemoRadiSam system protein B|nr:AmmeMemoRadiSam system protein A [Treponema sp.]
MKKTRKAFLVPHPPLIVPGVGKGDEIPATRDAYIRVVEEVIGENPETVIIISPHGVCYADYFHISPGPSATGDFGAFHAPNIRFFVRYDEALASRIGETAEKAGVHAGKLGERDAGLDHGVMVPLYFLQSPRIIRVGLSGLPLIDHYRFGMCIREAADALGRDVVLLASGDMSHKLKTDGPYGFAKEGVEHDAFVKECIERSDFKSLLAVDPALRERAAECGFRSLVILAGYMDALQTRSRVLSYECPFGVGYLTAAFSGDNAAPSLLPALLDERKARLARKRDTNDPYVRLAINAIECFVKTGKIMAPPAPSKGIPAEMLEKRAGVFVSVKKDGALRGCIGTIAPVRKNIALEIIENGVSAVSRDPRFPPVEEEELESLTYSVDILSPPESINDPGALDVVKYGVIVNCGNRRGLLLPNLDGVESVEDQISIALRKGGIQPYEPYTLERFEVTRHT